MLILTGSALLSIILINLFSNYTILLHYTPSLLSQSPLIAAAKQQSSKISQLMNNKSEQEQNKNILKTLIYEKESIHKQLSVCVTKKSAW